MNVEFRFPLRSEERVVLLASALIALFIPLLLLAQIQMLAEASGQTLGGVLRTSYPLRGSLALLGLILLVSAAGTAAWVRHRSGTGLVVTDEALRWEAPTPLVGRGKEPARTLPLHRIREIAVGRVRAAFTRHIVVRVRTADGDELSLPLDRALRDGKACASFVANEPRTWTRHELVRTLEAATGLTCRRD